MKYVKFPITSISSVGGSLSLYLKPKQALAKVNGSFVTTVTYTRIDTLVGVVLGHSASISATVEDAVGPQMQRE